MISGPPAISSVKHHQGGTEVNEGGGLYWFMTVCDRGQQHFTRVFWDRGQRCLVSACARSEGAAAGQQRPELAGQCRCAPGGQRQTGPQWMSSVCPVSFGSQRGLLSSNTPHSPRPWPFVCRPCSLWTRRSLAFHMRLCPITLLTPLEPRESVPVFSQLHKTGGRGVGGGTHL